MCYTCGCKLPFEDHGDPANVTEAHFEQAAETDAIGSGSVVTAKENMIELLRLQSEADELAEPMADYS